MMPRGKVCLTKSAAMLHRCTAAEMALEGACAKEIAYALDTSPSQVRKWLLAAGYARVLLSPAEQEMIEAMRRRAA
jgi:uncharacterized protein YjcR